MTSTEDPKLQAKSQEMRTKAMEFLWENGSNMEPFHYALSLASKTLFMRWHKTLPMVINVSKIVNRVMMSVAIVWPPNIYRMRQGKISGLDARGLVAMETETGLMIDVYPEI